MARGRPEPSDIAAGLERGARAIGAIAMVFGAACIGASAYLLFATEVVSLWMLFCLATMGLLSVLAGYQKLRAGHRATED